jgi:hypothetical protein
LVISDSKLIKSPLDFKLSISHNVPSICDVAVLFFRLAHLLLFICIFSLNSCKRCDKSHVPKGTDVLFLNFIPSSANALLCALIIGRAKSYYLLQLKNLFYYSLTSKRVHELCTILNLHEVREDLTVTNLFIDICKQFTHS